MEKKRIPAIGNSTSKGLEVWKVHGNMEDVKYSIIARSRLGDNCNGKKIWKARQVQNIQCPES